MQYKNALPLLQSAAKEGYGEACYYLGDMYENGLGVTANLEIARRMYEKAIEFGYGKGYAELGRMYENGNGGCAKDMSKAFSLYKQGHEKGDWFSGYLLALCYVYGKGADQDFAKAFTLCNSLLNEKPGQNLTWAYEWVSYYMGHFYDFGLGTAKDVKKALTYYNRSNKPDALYRAALLMDENGMGTFGGESKSGFLWRAVEKYGLKDARAYYLLSQWLPSTGPLATSDSIRFNYLLKSAEMGYVPAYKLCGEWYEKGKGTAVNLIKAREWYAKAKANGETVPEL